MKRIFDISEPDRDIIASLREKIDNLTKPKVLSDSLKKSLLR